VIKIPEAIIDGTGSGNFWIINQSGAGLVTDQQTSPIDQTKNNPAFLFEYIISGPGTGVNGSRIGTITQFIGPGSFVNVLTYDNNRITNVGSWS